MAYAVELTLRAERDLGEFYEYLEATSSEGARRWLNGLEKAIYTLERFPRRCPRAPEAGRSRRPLRHLLYGTKLNTYRVLYEIDEAGKKVRVVSIRHGARDALAASKRKAQRPRN